MGVGRFDLGNIQWAHISTSSTTSNRLLVSKQGEQGTENQIQKDRQKHSAPPKQLCDIAEEPEKANHKASEKS